MDDEDRDDRTSYNRNRLLQAVRDGDIEIVKYMIQDGMNQDLHEECCFLAIEKRYINILQLVFDKKYLKGYPEEIFEYENSLYMSQVLDTESVEGVDFLLSQGFKLITLDRYPWSAFIYCIQHDKKDILKYIITLPQMQYPKYQLCFAAMTRDASILKKSLEYPELLSEIDECYDIRGNQFPPICCCLFADLGKQKTYQELDCAKLLIEAGADIKSCTVAITLAANSQDVKTILYLMDKGVGLDAYNLTDTLVTVCGMTDGDVALSLKCIKRLIEAGADPHAPDDQGITPLSASIGKNREIFDYILDLNLDKRYIDVKCGISMKIPILTSVFKSYPSDLELIEKILKTRCDVNLDDSDSNTPLMHVSGILHLNLVKLLLDYGADVNACNNDGKNAGNHCLEYYNDADDDPEKINHSKQRICVLKLLIDRGMTLDNEYNLLLSAFENFDLECINFLLETDIEKDTIGDLDQNILHLAADRRLGYDVYFMFLKKVKNINQKDKFGSTPLNIACRNFSVFLVQLLIDNGCDVNTMNDDGGSALVEIVRRGDVSLTRALLKAGARPEELLKDRIAWLGMDDCLTLVLENGGDVLLNTPDDKGNYIIARAIHNCRYEGDEWMVNNILTYNPDLTNLFLKNIAPAPIFLDEDYFDILDLLYQSGAPKSELVKNSSDDVVELFEERIADYTLKSRCRRIIRQTLGLGIKEKVKKLSLPAPLNDFLLLKDIIHESYFQLD